MDIDPTVLQGETASVFGTEIPMAEYDLEAVDYLYVLRGKWAQK